MHAYIFIMFLVSPSQQIKCFNLIADGMGIAKTQTAVLEYEAPSSAAAAVSGLSGVHLGEARLSLQSVPQAMAALLLLPSANRAAPLPAAPYPARPPAPAPAKANPLLRMPPTPALQLDHMVGEDALRDDELYAELMEDVADECNSHGTVRSIVIPRPADATTVEDRYSLKDTVAGITMALFAI
jgi:hypothetical protein